MNALRQFDFGLDSSMAAPPFDLGYPPAPVYDPALDLTPAAADAAYAAGTLPAPDALGFNLPGWSAADLGGLLKQGFSLYQAYNSMATQKDLRATAAKTGLPASRVYVDPRTGRMVSTAFDPSTGRMTSIHPNTGQAVTHPLAGIPTWVWIAGGLGLLFMITR